MMIAGPGAPRLWIYILRVIPSEARNLEIPGAADIKILLPCSVAAGLSSCSSSGLG
jgi:hypothetical protein